MKKRIISVLAVAIVACLLALTVFGGGTDTDAAELSKEDMKNWMKAKTAESKPYLYMYMGNGDDMEKQLYPAFVKTCDIIKEIYPKELYKIVIKEEGKHNEAEWEPVFKDFLHDFLAKND